MKEEEVINTTKQKQRISTKISRYVFLALLILVVLESVYNPSKSDKLKDLVELMVEINIYTFIATLVGANKIDKLADFFSNYRGKK